MAEMTAAEAIEELKPVWISDRSGPDTLEVVISVEQGRQISALIEQQAAEIAQLNAQLQEQEKFVQVQAQEIAKQDKMLKMATKELTMHGLCHPDCKDEGDCGYTATAAMCCGNWLAWLEKEAEVQE